MTSEANSKRFRVKEQVEGDVYSNSAQLSKGEVRAFRTDEPRSVVGDMAESFAAAGDWVVTTAEGNHFAVRDEIFREMFEPVTDGDEP